MPKLLRPRWQFLLPIWVSWAPERCYRTRLRDFLRPQFRWWSVQRFCHFHMQLLLKSNRCRNLLPLLQLPQNQKVVNRGCNQYQNVLVYILLWVYPHILESVESLSPVEPIVSKMLFNNQLIEPIGVRKHCLPSFLPNFLDDTDVWSLIAIFLKVWHCQHLIGECLLNLIQTCIFSEQRILLVDDSPPSFVNPQQIVCLHRRP